MMSPDAPDMKDHERWMRRALELAAQACGQTRPNPAVGAVIVSREGTLLGEGFHRRAGQPHAEVEALSDARLRLGVDVGSPLPPGATMYVTLEPCNHTGRTGPCSETVIAAGVARVVIAMRDPHGTASGGMARLEAAGIEVMCGVLEREALLLNAAFNTCHLLGRPLITLKWAMTLDGCTAVPSGDSMWITGEAARADVHRRRAAHDAVLAGVGTVLRDGARLTARDTPIPPGPARLRVVADTRLRLPVTAPFFRCSEDDGSLPIVACGELVDEASVAAREAVGARVWRLPPGPGGVALNALVDKLHEAGVQSIYVEGGRTLAGALAQAGLVDRVECWIAPKLAGGGELHLGPLRFPAPLAAMSGALDLHHASTTVVGGDFLIEGWVTRHLHPGS